jgi:hypothetical protein
MNDHEKKAKEQLSEFADAVMLKLCLAGSYPVLGI